MIGTSTDSPHGMPRFRRLVVPGFPHHVTQRGVRRQRTFFEADDYRNYLRMAIKLIAAADLDIWAYCLMPNHIHAIAVPHNRCALSKFFGQLHRAYATATNKKNDWKGHLWQERFYSVVMDESHTTSAIRYVERNPVRAGLCAQPQDWPWSSARAHLGLTTDPLVDDKVAQDIIGDWKSYLRAADIDKELQMIRSQTDSGRPDGDRHFLRRLEVESGRSLTRRKPGPKKKLG